MLVEEAICVGAGRRCWDGGGSLGALRWCSDGQSDTGRHRRQKAAVSLQDAQRRDTHAGICPFTLKGQREKSPFSPSTAWTKLQGLRRPWPERR